MTRQDTRFIRNAIRAKKIEEYGYWFCDRCGSRDIRNRKMHHIIFQSEKPGHKHLHHERNLIDLCNNDELYFHEQKDKRNYLIEERNLTELFGNDIL